MADPTTPTNPNPSLQLISLYDNTRISAYRNCPRYFYFGHVRNWQADRKSLPLAFGSSWHAAQDVIWRRHAEPKDKLNDIADEAYAAFITEWVSNDLPAPENMSPDELEDMTPRTPQVAQEMIYNYLDARWTIFHDPGFELVDIEKPFAVPLDPNNPSLWYVGRLDKVFKFRGKYVVGEHKSSSAYRKDGGFRADFLDQWSPNSQIDGYLYTLRLLYGNDASAVWVDAALVHKQVHNAFRFIPVERQFAQLDAWLWETHAWIDQIEGNLEVLEERSALDTPYLAAFPKNTSSCTNYGGCPYADICKAVPNPAKLDEPPLGYKVQRWSPVDELKLEKIGFKVANNGEVLKEKS
jgi:hypothetical protein